MPSGGRCGWFGALAGLVVAAALASAQPGTPLDWHFDVVRLKNGAVFRGLILDESPAGVRFQNVRQQPGRPTVLFNTSFTRAEIDTVEHLDDSERDRLKAHLRDLDPTGQAEKQRMEELALEPIAWAGKPAAGRRYTSEHFVLESDAAEPVVRRAAVRLEQIYAAYERYLPPRATGRPTTVLLFQSRAGYEARLKSERLRFVNLAFYDPAANRVLCASDLEQLGQRLDEVRRKHQQLRADLDKQESALTKLYRGRELTQLLQPIRDTRTQIDKADRQNEAAFDQAARHLFSVLYHEAFHAYLTGWVYPPPQPEPPRWLNEGLAEVFETAFVEAGELRVGHAERDRLFQAKAALRANELVPLAKLLRSAPRDFLAAHASDQAASDRHYLTAWALAFHLTFERRLLGSAALDGYLAALARGADPEETFATLVGQPLPAFERDFHRHLLQLLPDGTTDPRLPDK